MKHFLNGLISISLIFLPLVSPAANKPLAKKKLYKLGAEILAKSLKKMQREGLPAIGTPRYENAVAAFPFLEDVYKQLNEPESQNQFEKLKIIEKPNSTVWIKHRGKKIVVSKINYYDGSFMVNRVKINMKKLEGIKDVKEFKKQIRKDQSSILEDLLLPKAHGFFFDMFSSPGKGAVSGGILGGLASWAMAGFTFSPQKILTGAGIGLALGTFIGWLNQRRSKKSTNSTNHRPERSAGSQ